MNTEESPYKALFEEWDRNSTEEAEAAFKKAEDEAEAMAVEEAEEWLKEL